jgi:hypothetical protein
MSLKRKEYKVDDRTKKAALLFLACDVRQILTQDSQTPLQ